MSRKHRHIKSQHNQRGIICYFTKPYKCDLYFRGNYGN